MLLNDDQDLIHKAVGWMLREVGNRESDVLRVFLQANVTKMPRTMLRYSIEKFSESERKKWLTYKG
jgi:3-methyladenine DNA glycosylase AlkD